MAIKIPSSGPKSHCWLLHGECSQRWRSLKKRVTEHPFNHSVELLVPGSVTLPMNFDLALVTPRCYYTAHLPLSHLIRPEIISEYLVSGSLCALSVGTRIDVDNVYALLPTGKLIMSLDKDTYEQLGLQGKPSRYMKNQRFVVELDLLAPHFKPGKPNYDRVKWCLSERLDLEADFVINWNSSDPSLEAKFLEDFKATRFDCTTDSETLHSFLMPTILGDHPHGLVKNDELFSCPIKEFHTWVGVVANGGLSTFYEGSAPGDYVTTFIPPEPHCVCEHGVRRRWTGMMSSSYVINLLECIRDYLSSESGTTPKPPWIVVNVWGFEDSPVSWKTNEHGHYLCGDNHYTVVLFNTGHYWCLSMLGTHDYV